MKRALLALAAASTLATTGACSSDLPAASFIDKLRVLAVRAEPPEVPPGGTTALDYLAVEPPLPQLDGGAAPSPPSAVWLACALPSGTLTVAPCGVGSGLSASTMPPFCKDQPSAPLCIIGTDATATYTTDADVLPAGASSTQILLTVAVADTAAGAIGCLVDIANNGGLPTDPDHCVVSLKRLDVTDPAKGAPPNANPTLSQFYATTPSGFAETLDTNDGTWQYAPGEDLAEWNVAAIRAPDAAEVKPDGTYEAVTVSWFTSAGHLDGGRSIYLPPGCNQPSSCATERPEDGADTTWFAPTADEAAGFVDAGGAVDFWAVIRDDRGGVGWKSGRLTLSP